MLDRPKVGVGVIVWHEGKVLMQERIGAHGEGWWSFPGGHLEFGEALEACAVRETEEEVGVRLGAPRVVSVTNDVFEDEGKHYITVFVQGHLESGVPRVAEPHRARRIGWFAWEDMPRPLFLPIEHLLEQGFHPKCAVSWDRQNLTAGSRESAMMTPL